MSEDRKSKLDQVMEWVLANPHSAAKDREIAATFGTSRDTVIRARRKARRRNPDLPVRSINGARAVAKAEEQLLTDIGQRISEPAPLALTAPPAELASMEPEEQFLHSLVWDKKLPTAERRAALQDLEKYRASRKPADKLGPRAPVTVSEVIRRLADQLEGVGKDYARRAWHEAFEIRPFIAVRKPKCNPETDGSAAQSPSFAPSSAASDTESSGPSESELNTPESEMLVSTSMKMTSPTMDANSSKSTPPSDPPELSLEHSSTNAYTPQMIQDIAIITDPPSESSPSSSVSESPSTEPLTPPDPTHSELSSSESSANSESTPDEKAPIPEVS